MFRKTLSSRAGPKTWNDLQEKVFELSAPTSNQRSVNNIQVTKRMVKLLGLEESMNQMQFVHVAGSKGKGSTSAYTAKLLEAAGLKVGLFTSPHLYDVRERFKINYDMLPQDRFIEYFFDIYDKQKDIEVNAASDFDRSASKSGFFRFCFYLALHAFSQEQVDVVVLETGLGGRIDSTNIVTPKVCGITALGMEHTEILGDTIEKIAAEKAGIIKSGIPCFTDPQKMYPSALEVLRSTAFKTEAPILVADERMVAPKIPKLAMAGEHMVHNARLGLALSRFVLERPLIEPIYPDEEKVLSETTFDGRSQVVKANDKVTFYIDGAHTPESMQVATKWFQEVAEADSSRRNVMLFYTQRDPAKLFPEFTDLRVNLNAMVFLPVEYTRIVDEDVFKNCQRQWSERFPEVNCKSIARLLKTPEEYIAVAQTDPISGEVHEDAKVNVFVTGSLYLVGTVLKALRNEFE